MRHLLKLFLRPDTLPQAIVFGSVVLVVGAVLVAFIKKAPFYALILIVLAMAIFLLSA